MCDWSLYHHPAENVVKNDVTKDALASIVHNTLPYYDLPDLVSLVGEDRVIIKDPVDAGGRLVSPRR